VKISSTEQATLDARIEALFAGDPAALADPYPLYRELRRLGSVYDAGSMVLVSGHADVKELMRDGVRYSMRAKAGEGTRNAELRAQLERELTEEQLQAADAIVAFQGLVMSRNDGETHARLRRVGHRALTPRAVAESEQTIRRTLDDLLAPLLDSVVCDLRGLAFQLPVAVITAMLGVPREDMELVHGWTTMLNRAQEPGSAVGAFEMLQQHRHYGAELVARYRAAPDSTPPLAASMFDAREEERLSADELSAMFLNLIFAGHETTSNLIVLGLLELHRRPDQWRLLAADPSLAPQAVEELLRYVSPVQSMIRLAVEDVEIGGVAVEAGRTVIPMIASANRDADVFERPDELDVSRPASDHIAFGLGPHFCIGASLARAEARIALETLARRFPEMSLAEGDVEWTGSAVVRTIRALPVRLGPEAR
jgi:cytochrome P450